MSASPPGRPRDPEIDDRILAAARTVLLEVGYAALTIEAVSARAHVSRPTVYRRYSSKVALVFDAVFGQTKSQDIPKNRELSEDLREAYGWAVDEFASPESKAALPGLLADLAANGKLLHLVRELVVEPEVSRVRDRLREAQDRGEIRPDADLDLAIDAFLGTALARTTLVDRPVDHAYGNALVDLIMNGLAPR